MWEPQQYERQKQALKFLNISEDVWNSSTPAERREKFRRIHINAMREYHPDRHSDLVEGSSEYLEMDVTIKLLTSIDYDYATVPDVAARVEAAFKPDFSPSRRSKPQYVPATFDELLRGLRSHHNVMRLEYYEQVKESIPNLVPWSKWVDVRETGGVGQDYPWIVNQIATKRYLQGYKGADVLVSALVSQNQERIKGAFDQMILHIRKTSYLMTFFGNIESRLNTFIDQFCRFKPDDSFFVGIDAKTTLLICRSLSLLLPYQVINPVEELDEGLIRMELRRYIYGIKPVLQLEDKPTAAIKSICQ